MLGRLSFLHFRLSYEGSKHGSGGWLVLFFAGSLAAIDGLEFLKRAFHFFRSPNRTNLRVFWRRVVQNQDEVLRPEYAHLVHDEPGEYEEVKLVDELEQSSSSAPRIATSMETFRMRSSESITEMQQDWPRSAATVGVGAYHARHNSTFSDHSDDTLHTPGILTRSGSHDSYEESEPKSLLANIVHYSFATAERSLVLMAYAELLSGLTVYSGMCRGNYLNGCMAHLISE